MFVILLFFSQACIIIFPMNGGILMKGNRFDAFCEKTSLKQNAFSGKLYSAFCRADNQINSKQKLNVAIIAAVNSKNISTFVLPASLCTGVGPGTKFITSLLFMPSLPPFHAL